MDGTTYEDGLFLITYHTYSGQGNHGCSQSAGWTLIPMDSLQLTSDWICRRMIASHETDRITSKVCFWGQYMDHVGNANPLEISSRKPTTVSRAGSIWQPSSVVSYGRPQRPNSFKAQPPNPLAFSIAAPIHATHPSPDCPASPIHWPIDRKTLASMQRYTVRAARAAVASRACQPT